MMAFLYSYFSCVKNASSQNKTKRCQGAQATKNKSCTNDQLCCDINFYKLGMPVPYSPEWWPVLDKKIQLCFQILYHMEDCSL